MSYALNYDGAYPPPRSGAFGAYPGSAVNDSRSIIDRQHLLGPDYLDPAKTLCDPLAWSNADHYKDYSASNQTLLGFYQIYAGVEVAKYNGTDYSRMKRIGQPFITTADDGNCKKYYVLASDNYSWNMNWPKLVQSSHPFSDSRSIAAGLTLGGYNRYFSYHNQTRTVDPMDLNVLSDDGSVECKRQLSGVRVEAGMERIRAAGQLGSGNAIPGVAQFMVESSNIVN